MVCADGRKFRFWLFNLAKKGLFFYRNQVSQALYLSEFVKTYNDKVINLRLEEQSNSRKRKKWCEKFSKWSKMQQKQERLLSKC